MSATNLTPPPAGGWRGSLRLRLLAGTLAWIVATLAVSGWALAQLFGQHLTRQFEAELSTHLDQLAANLVVDAAGAPALRGPLGDPRFARPYSGLYWQADRLANDAGPAERGVLRARSLWDAVLVVPADALADGERHVHRVEGPDGEPLRMIERVLRPAEQPERPLRLVVAADERHLTQPVERFNGMLAAALALLGAGLAAAAVAQVWIGLRPLARLREVLADVREGRAAAIDGRFPTEVQPLVDEFNGVLARNAEIVARARTQAGNLAHAVKTPLAVLANAAAGESGPFATLVAEQVGAARTQVDHHLARARAAAAVASPGQRTPLAPVLEGLMRVMARVHGERGLALELAPCPDGLAFRGEAQDLHEMLGNLLDNACKWARRRVEVRALKRDGLFAVEIDDDGPGLAPALREEVFGRGVRADERAPGSGLGLAITRELARLYGGDVTLDASPAGGLRATLVLPRA